MTTLCRVPYFPLLVPVVSFVCCVSCFVCRRCGCGNCCLFVVSLCLYPCRFACTLFSVPLLGVGVWGVGVVLLGLPGVFPGSGLALWVCVPCSVCPLLGRVCLGRGWCVCGCVGVLCCAVVPFLVCMVCGLYVVCCF